MKKIEPKKHKYYSHSQLALWDRCPSWFNARYNKGMQDHATPVMIFGSVVHKALETIHNEARAGKDLGPDDCQRIWDDVFSGKIPIWRYTDKARQTQEQVKINLPASFYMDGLIGFKSYAERNLTEVRNIFKSELDLKVKVGDYDLRCIFDRVDLFTDTIRVVEFKSGRKIPSREELRENLQLDIEALVAQKEFGLQQKIQVAYFSFLSGAMIIVDKTQEDIDATESYLLHTFKKIETDTKWLPRLNDYCHECPESEGCALYRSHMVKHLEVENFNTLLAGDGEPIGKLYQDTNTRIKLLTERKELLKMSLESCVLNAGGELNTPEGNWKMTQFHKKEYTVAEHDESQLRFYKAVKGRLNDTLHGY